jgi:hypothetical protein
MAATIARATGHDSNRSKETHRLGSQSSRVEAATWHTSAEAYVTRDGSGSIEVSRDGRIIARVSFGPEDAPDAGQPSTVEVRDAEGLWLALDRNPRLRTPA